VIRTIRGIVTEVELGLEHGMPLACAVRVDSRELALELENIRRGTGPEPHRPRPCCYLELRRHDEIGCGSQSQHMSAGEPTVILNEEG
jgi:hypothetical protein